MSRTALLLVVLLAPLAFSACSPLPALGLGCADAGPGAVLFWNEPVSLQRGQEIWLSPYVSSHPGSVEPLSAACLTDVRVSPPEAGRVEQRDDDWVLVVADDAELTAVHFVRASYRGRNVSGRFSVYDEQASPLVGYWAQQEEGCDPEAVIRELIFSADGTFSVTWTPFETYKDYWGTYSYDAAAGRLELQVEGGNGVPEGISSGTVTIDGGELRLGTASFGRYRDRAECRAAFRG